MADQPGSAPATPKKLICKICDRGELVRKALYRMSRPVVLIGYLLLIPSVVGMASGAGVLLYVNWLSFNATYQARTQGGVINEAQRQIGMAKAEMQGAGVPEEIVDTIIYPGSRGVPTGDDLESELREFPNLSPTQRDIIRYAAKKSDESEKAWADAADAPPNKSAENIEVLGFIGSGLALIVAISSFVGGLLGWLLVMKKKVLQCSVCGAVVNAS